MEQRAQPRRRRGRLWARRSAPGRERPAKRAWEIRARVVIDWIQVTMDGVDRPLSGRKATQAEDVQKHLAAAESYLSRRPSLATWWAGTRIDGAWGHIGAASVSLLGVVDRDELVGMAPWIVELVTRYLPADDPNRRAVQDWVDWLSPVDRGGVRHRPPPDGPPDPVAGGDRELLANALRAAYSRQSDQFERLRRFQGKVVGSVFVLMLLVVLLTAIGWHEPQVVPLCFPDPDSEVEEATASAAEADQNTAGQPAAVVCPSSDTPAEQPGDAPDDASDRASSGDVATVVLFGLVGAALTSVQFVVRPAPSTALPLTSARIFQALLKAATGMLTAILGLLFLRAGVVPGFTRIDTRSQLIVYAVVFGAAQQLVTRLIDSRSDALIGSVAPTQDPQAASTPANANSG
jgi:hypothetical protein